MTVKAFVFDWSGTLINDLQQVYTANMNVVAEMDATPITLNEFREKFTVPVAVFFASLGVHRQPEVLEAAYERQYIAAVQAQNRPKLFADAARTLRYLHEHQLLIAIVSTHPEALLMRELRTTFGLPVDSIIGSCENKDRCISRLLIDKGILPSDTIYVGDLDTDIGAGHEAGVWTAALTTGYHSKTRLVAARPDGIFDSLTDLMVAWESGRFPPSRQNIHV